MSDELDIGNELFVRFKEFLDDTDCEGSMAIRAFLENYESSVANILSLFAPDGRLRGKALPASCYNDFYKWTMFPVISSVEKAFDEDVRCTFSVNIRDNGYRKQLYESAIGRTSQALFEEVKSSLSSLARRKFDRETFERCVAEYELLGWDTEAVDRVCGTSSKPRTLVQEFVCDIDCKCPLEPSNAGEVLLQVFVAHDEKIKEERVYIEATGPWHRVTWLETSMMQAVYEPLLRHRKREEYGEEDARWYPKWLAECLCRCARSIVAAREAKLPGALFTGRRTGGLALMMLQGLYAHHAFKSADGKEMLLGSSSVTSRYMSFDVGVPREYVPKCAGTHAHELSMVLGALLGEVDDTAGLPLSQIVGHLLYFYLSQPNGKEKVMTEERKVLMPMLSDTLGTRAFMSTAKKLKIPFGPNENQSFLSIIGAARQDSGTLDEYRRMMYEFGFHGAVMASEIETADDLFKARDNGFKLFGAGGFMGDSEKAWDASKKNISMACKVLRVYARGCRTALKYGPVKTGETSHSGVVKDDKFEADGTLSDVVIQQIKDRAQMQANAIARLDDSALQKLLVDTMKKFPEVGDSLTAAANTDAQLATSMDLDKQVNYAPGLISGIKSLAQLVGQWIHHQFEGNGDAADAKMRDIEDCWRELCFDKSLQISTCHQIRDVAVAAAAVTLARMFRWDDLSECQKDFELACDPIPEKICESLWRRTQDVFLSLARLTCAKCKKDKVCERQEQRVYDRHVRNLAGVRKVSVKDELGEKQQNFSEEVARIIPANVVMLSTCIEGPASNSPRTPYSKGVQGRCNETMHKALAESPGRSWMELLWAMRKHAAQESCGTRQVPVLSSSRRMDLNTPFSVRHPNVNGRRRAVLIGINYTGQHGLELSTGHQDVEKMQKFLLAQGYQHEEMKLLVDDGVQAAPTREAIEASMRWLVQGSSPGDSLLFHYSGHGSTFTGNPDDPFFGGGEHGSDEALCPVDFRTSGMLFDDEVFKHLIRPLREGVLLTCVVDCCQSGTILQLPYVFKAEVARLSSSSTTTNGAIAEKDAAMTPNSDYDQEKMLQVIQTHPAMCAAAVHWANELTAMDPSRHEEQFGSAFSQVARSARSWTHKSEATGLPSNKEVTEAGPRDFAPEENSLLGEALKHKDTIDRIAAVFCGALKYGSRARSEIFEDVVKNLPSHPGHHKGDKGTRRDGRRDSKELTDVFRNAVRGVKTLTSQVGFLEENKKTQSDNNFLMVKVEGWLEVLDPKHRYGGNLKFYYPKWRDSGTQDSFFHWLEEGEGKHLDLEECPREQLDTQLVKYLTIIERESYLVKPKNGRLCFEQSGELLEGKLIFVMSVRGWFYAGTKVKGRFHHSSFLGGGGVLVAGAAEFKDGLFTSLTPHSGHYHPKPEDFQDFISYLSDAGLDSVNVALLSSWSHDSEFGKKRAKN